MDDAIKNATSKDVDVTSPPYNFMMINSKYLDVIEALYEYDDMLEEYKKQYEELNSDHFKNDYEEVLKALRIVKRALDKIEEINHCVPCKEIETKLKKSI